MANTHAHMLLTTRLTGVTFNGRQEKLADLRKQGSEVSHKLRHHNNFQEYDGIAIFHGSQDLGWIPKEIASELLLPEITSSTIQIDNIEFTEIVGGTKDKENYGAEIVIFLSGDAHTLDVLSESINDLKRKATEAVVMGSDIKNISEIKDSRIDKIKKTSVDNEHKLFIVGSSQVQPNDVRKVLHEYGIHSNQCKIENDYYALKNTDEIPNKFKYLFFGPTPHSGRGIGDETSIIDYYKQLPNFVVKTISSKSGQLKYTTEGLKQALDELVIA